MKTRALIAAGVCILLFQGCSGGQQEKSVEKTPKQVAAKPTPSPTPETVIAAVQENDFVALARALESGGDPNARTANGEPVIMLADAATAKLLLEHGADANATDSEGNTALHNKALGFFISTYVGGFGNRTATLVLSADESGELEGKRERDLSELDLSSMWREDEATASLVPDFNYFDVLIAHGADINAKNSSGDTPLDEAVAMPKMADVSGEQLAASAWFKFLRS